MGHHRCRHGLLWGLPATWTAKHAAQHSACRDTDVSEEHSRHGRRDCEVPVAVASLRQKWWRDAAVPSSGRLTCSHVPYAFFLSFGTAAKPLLPSASVRSLSCLLACLSRKSSSIMLAAVLTLCWLCPCRMYWRINLAFQIQVSHGQYWAIACCVCRSTSTNAAMSLQLKKSQGVLARSWVQSCCLIPVQSGIMFRILRSLQQ